MNIALFTDTYPPFINGVSTSCFNLVKALRQHGHNVVIVTPKAGNIKEIEFTEDGMIYMPGLELKSLYGYRITSLYSKKIINYLRKFKVDLIHNQTDSTIGQFAKIAAKELNVPLLYTYHTAIEDYTYYVTKGMADRFAKKVVRGYSKMIAKGSTEFITPSDKTKDYIRSVGSDVYVNVIPTGIDFSIFGDDRVDRERQEAFRKEHHIGPNTKTFLILGRIAKEKSMDFSIRGFSHYHRIHPEADIRMLVVGNGPQKQELEQLVYELKISDIVDFIGAVPAAEVPFYYHLADIYTSASITETQGLTFMEAMVSHDIVLARFDSQLCETIIDGVSGYFFTDEASFVEKVEEIFSSSEEKLDSIRQGALRIVEKYSLDRFYENIMEAYRRALKKYW